VQRWKCTNGRARARGDGQLLVAVKQEPVAQALGSTWKSARPRPFLITTSQTLAALKKRAVSRAFRTTRAVLDRRCGEPAAHSSR